MKIVIIEDQVMLREVIRKACTQDFGYSVVGEASSGAVATALVAKLRPHILILDLSLPDLDGFSVADQVRQVAPATRILILSSYTNDYTIFRLERIGVDGFIDKNTDALPRLKEALATLEAGETYFSPTFRAIQKAIHLDPHSFSKLLSNSEKDVVHLICYGFDDDEIGARLKISPRTAQTHRSNILKKLSLKGTPKLVEFAIELGFRISRPPFHPRAGGTKFQ